MSELYDNFDKKHLKATSKYIRTSKRTLIKTEGILPANAEKGIVVAALARKLIVEPNNNPNKIIECTTAGSLVSSNVNSTIATIGDEVWFLRRDKSSAKDFNLGTIIKIEERKNCFTRKAAGKEPYEQVLASNVDKVLIFMSALHPLYNRRLIDRLVVASELNCILPIICINKIDLIDTKELSKDFDIYVQLGIEVFFTSIIFNRGVNKLYNAINTSNILMCGPSGVGKSSFLNNIFGNEYQVVQDIAESTSKGKHTTSSSKLFRFSEGGSIIDTPGIREFGIWGLERNELSLYFHDFDKFSLNCKYPSCTHTHEPECSIIEAYENHELDPQRYESYLNILDSLEV